MGKLTELQQDIVNDQVSLATILRKASIFAYELDNEEFKTWVNQELSGYPTPHGDLEAYVASLPKYRVATVASYGTLVLGLTTWSKYRIPVSLMPSELQRQVQTVTASQGIPTIHEMSRADTDVLHVNWSEYELFVLNTEMEKQRGHFVSAYREVPKTLLVEILNTVRDRLLAFTLELKRKYPETDAENGNAATIVSDSAVKQIFNITINEGGNMSVFDQSEQSVAGNQYNAAGNINIGMVQTHNEFVQELQRFEADLLSSSEFADLDEDKQAEVRYSLRKAVIEAKKTDADKITIKQHIENTIGVIKDVATLAGAVISLHKIIEVVNTIPWP